MVSLLLEAIRIDHETICFTEHPPSESFSRVVHRKIDRQSAVQSLCDFSQIILRKVVPFHLVMKILGADSHSSGEFCFGDVAPFHQKDSDFFSKCHRYHLDTNINDRVYVVNWVL